MGRDAGASAELWRRTLEARAQLRAGASRKRPSGASVVGAAAAKAPRVAAAPAAAVDPAFGAATPRAPPAAAHAAQSLAPLAWLRARRDAAACDVPCDEAAAAKAASAAESSMAALVQQKATTPVKLPKGAASRRQSTRDLAGSADPGRSALVREEPWNLRPARRGDAAAVAHDGEAFFEPLDRHTFSDLQHRLPNLHVLDDEFGAASPAAAPAQAAAARVPARAGSRAGRRLGGYVSWELMDHEGGLGGKVAELVAVSVRQELRQKGLGRRLLTFAVARARQESTGGVSAITQFLRFSLKKNTGL